MKKFLIKIATWIGAAIVLVHLIFSERKRQEWQRVIELLDATNRKLEQNLAEIVALRAKQSG
jgi:tRNA 2-selenouridine synthase SelU